MYNAQLWCPKSEYEQKLVYSNLFIDIFPYLETQKMDFEKQLELAEAETISVRNELKIAQRRIDDLQVAIQGDMDTSVGESEDDEDEDGDPEMWIEAAKKRILSSQASSLYMTDTTDKSLSNISVNSNDRESLDLAN